MVSSVLTRLTASLAVVILGGGLAFLSGCCGDCGSKETSCTSCSSCGDTCSSCGLANPNVSYENEPMTGRNSMENAENTSYENDNMNQE